MKRNILTVILASLLLVYALTTTFACASPGSGINELRDCVYKSETGSFSVSAYSGRRESEYRLDGVGTKLKDYLVVVLCGDYAQAPTLTFNYKGATNTCSSLNCTCTKMNLP